MNKRHKWIWKTFLPAVRLFCKCNLNYHFEVAKNLPEQYIVLSNHTTDYDPVLVACAFPKQMYYVASEHITRWKHGYKALHWALEPITRYKGKNAAATVMSILRKIKQGENICMFAEGARSWDGRTCPIDPATAKLVKAAKCALVIYHMHGGYFSSPLWSKSLRRGRIEGRVTRVYSVEEIAKMTEEELLAVIRDGLAEDAYAWQREKRIRYKGKNLAEGIENLLFICPHCGAYHSLHSKKDTVTCVACQQSFTYDEYGMLHGAPMQTLTECCDWQREKIAEDVKANTPYVAEAELYSVEKHESTLLERGNLILSREGVQLGNVYCPMDSISDFAMHGSHALVFQADKTYYEALIPKTDNAVRFFWYYWAYQAEKKKENT